MLQVYGQSAVSTPEDVARELRTFGFDQQVADDAARRFGNFNDALEDLLQRPDVQVRTEEAATSEPGAAPQPAAAGGAEPQQVQRVQEEGRTTPQREAGEPATAPPAAREAAAAAPGPPASQAGEFLADVAGNQTSACRAPGCHLVFTHCH